MNNRHTRQVDFVLAYPQAKSEFEIYMRLLRGIEILGMGNSTHTLKLLINLYGGKAACRIWIQYLCKGLSNMGFRPSHVDECVWYRDDTIFNFYVDSGIIQCPQAEGIAEFMRDIRNNDPKNRILILKIEATSHITWESISRDKTTD